ncbi:hypothetical protein DRP53_04450 [candidate division WOR-3 bacterium]|uniref:DUF4381 domain-containing protein n=1 Tax=candidate division WOR-3 bacterium TaxID=2052148 RepID=A0A660SIH9_UNCW3|nr:MAG: hypothetical protein DRP53_04450 [candidate division WOR-3 bacterium]
MIGILLFLTTIRLDVDTTLSGRITMGDRFEFLITITHPETLPVTDPIPDSLGPLMILKTDHKIEIEKGVRKDRYQYEAALFKTGPVRIPGFWSVVGSETLRTDPVQIRVRSLAGDMKEIDEIYEPFPFPNYLPYILIGLIALGLALGYFGLRLVRSLRRKVETPPPPLPAWDEAILALERIPVNDLIEANRFRELYYTLSEILKRYLERRYGFLALEQTTTEIKRSLRRHRIRERDRFGRFFDRADLVKYARSEPDRNEALAMVDEVKGLIEKTRPEEE